MRSWRECKYKNLLLLAISVLCVAALTKVGFFHKITEALGSLGYMGAFFAGLFFVSTFTVFVGSVLLFTLAENLTVWEIGLVAGLGAVVADFLIFKFVKDNLVQEVQTIYNGLGGKELNHVLHTKYFSWTLPLIGALIIASPLPDELGVSLMGLSKMKSWQFLVISFILNAAGITLVLLGASLIKQ